MYINVYMNTKTKLEQIAIDKWIEIVKEEWNISTRDLLKLPREDFELIYKRGMAIVAKKYPLLMKHKKIGLTDDLVKDIEETIHWNLSYGISAEETISDWDLTNDDKNFILDNLVLTNSDKNDKIN